MAEPAKREIAYLVMRRQQVAPVGGGPEHLVEAWVDVGEVKGVNADAAMKKAAGEGEQAVAGSYRAYPLSNDSRLDVGAEQQLVISYTKPETAKPKRTRPKKKGDRSGSDT